MIPLIGLPRISIIIPSYNQGKYLEAAIQSVLGQEYPSIELIVVDGASRDESLEIIQSYGNQLAWWISEPDAGQSQAVNKGFARATGEIITLLGSDDFYLPGAFGDAAKQYLQNQNAGAIIGAFCFLDNNQSAPGAPVPPFLRVSAPYDLTLGPPAVYRLHQVATFYTRTALDAVGRFVREDMKYVMDRELLYRVCRQFPIVLSRRKYGVFRRHPESKSVADILPFASEFSQLYREALSGDPRLDRLRRKMIAYRLSRGYVKYAKAVPSTFKRMSSLFLAAWYFPEMLLSAGYWSHYLKNPSKGLK